MVAIQRSQIAAATIERIANRAAPAGIGNIHPQLESLFLNIAIEVKIADSRLNERVRVGLIDLENPIHALQIQNHAARIRGRRTAISKIFSRRDWIDRNLVLVRDPDDLLHLFDIIRSDGRGRDQLVCLSPERRVSIAIERYVFVARENPLLADSVFKLLDRFSEIAGAYTWRNLHRALPSRPLLNLIVTLSPSSSPWAKCRTS